MFKVPDSLVEDIQYGVGPLAEQDLLSNEQYEAGRPSFLATLAAVKDARRLRLDDHLSLLFECRATVWLQIQEELRWTNAPTATDKRRLLDRYNLLVPEPTELRASLFLDSRERSTVRKLVSRFTIDLLQMELNLAGYRMAADSLEAPLSPLDAVNYIRFSATPASLIERDTIQWWCGVKCRTQVPEKVKTALLCDLEQPKAITKQYRPKYATMNE